jgi:hypothetical protein
MQRLVEHPPPRERFGVSPAQLCSALDVCYPRDHPEDAMVRSALSFALGALARAAEYALGEGEEFEVSEHLTPRDVTFFSNGGHRNARLKMRKRKDLRMLRGKHATVVLAGGGRFIDPVAALEKWLEWRATLGLPADGPLFCWPSGVAITTADVRRMVKYLMAAIGLDPTKYGAHSLRIGGATAALAAGVAPQLIRLLGRWSSDVYEIYCRMSMEAALAVGRAVTSAEVSTFEGGFELEHLELQPNEVDMVGRAMADATEKDSDDENDVCD